MIDIQFTDFANLKSDRLSLRSLRNSDANALFLLRTNSQVNQFLEREAPKEIADCYPFIEKINEGILQNKCTYWAICLLNQEELIGTICLWNFSEDRKEVELGYELLPEFQGKGYMNEALQKVIEFCFKTLQLDKILAYTHQKNQASEKLLVRNQFKIHPTLKDLENSNLVVYSLEVQSLKKAISLLPS